LSLLSPGLQWILPRLRVQYELPRQWIHTIGMLFSFDLVLIDKDHSWAATVLLNSDVNGGTVARVSTRVDSRGQR